MVIDFHSHILPGIDDGSRSGEESVAMLRASAEQGVRGVILTPHFYPERTSAEVFLERRQRSWERLQQMVRPGMGLPPMCLGAEVYYFPRMSQSASLEKLAIDGSRAILVEMPMTVWTEQMYRELEEIHRNLGLTPIVAHVDRYLGRFRDHGIPERLEELPVLVQANASSFLEGSRSMKMLRRHQIHLLGSDCHNMHERRPNLGPALEQIRRRLGNDAVRWIRSNEKTALNGQT